MGVVVDRSNDIGEHALSIIRSKSLLTVILNYSQRDIFLQFAPLFFPT